MYNFEKLISYSFFADCYCREPVKCGEVIRLQHLSTKRNLHSHLFQSPMSRNQEVSAFGENGLGDTGMLFAYFMDIL